MASDVDICNLALSFLGDDANVSSISPPEGSQQSEHCARFYPIARDGLLQMHNWNWASRRVALSQTISGIKPGVFYQGLPSYSLYFNELERNGDWKDVLPVIPDCSSRLKTTE